MSQENVEIMRAAFEAFNQRDGVAFDALLDREAEIVPVRAAVEQVAYRGEGAASQYCIAIDESWADLTWDVEEVRDGGVCVVALGRIRGRGRNSGAAIDARGGWVALFHEGLITRFQTFSDRNAALEALGLEE